MPDLTPSDRPVYQTDLTQTPLPEILVTIHRYKAPGVLDCRRGAEQKEIFLDRGHIVFATSNQVRDSLGDKLLADKRITQQQYDESVRRLLATQKRQGTILSEMGAISQKDMVAAVRDQIQQIVFSVFAWDSGSVTFTPGRDKHREFVKIDMPIPEAVISAIRRMPDAKALVARLGTRTTVFTHGSATYDELHLDPDEQRLLDTVDGKRTLLDLVNTPPLSAAMNARILYGFHALQLIAARAAGKVKVQVRTDGGSFTAQ